MKLPIHHFIDIQKYQKNNLILAPTGHLGISRSEMPQIDGKFREDFINWIRGQGLRVRDIRIPAKSIKLVQGEYNRDKVGAIIDSGNTEGSPIFVSKDGYVIDGNHRLIAHLNLPGASRYIRVTELGQDAKTLLDTISCYPNVRYRNLNNV